MRLLSVDRASFPPLVLAGGIIGGLIRMRLLRQPIAMFLAAVYAVTGPVRVLAGRHRRPVRRDATPYDGAMALLARITTPADTFPPQVELLTPPPTAVYPAGASLHGLGHLIDRKRTPHSDEGVIERRSGHQIAAEAVLVRDQGLEARVAGRFRRLHV